MSISQSQADNLTEEQKQEYCIWCWYFDRDDCPRCAIKGEKDKWKN